MSFILERETPPLREDETGAIRDIGLQGVDDPTILAWAANNERILLTRDRFFCRLN